MLKLPEPLKHLQPFLPLLLLRGDFNTVYLACGLFLFAAGTFAYEQWLIWNSSGASVFVHKRDVRVYNAVMHYIFSHVDYNMVKTIDFLTNEFNHDKETFHGKYYRKQYGKIKLTTKHWNGATQLKIATKTGVVITCTITHEITRVGAQNAVEIVKEGGITLRCDAANDVIEFVDLAIAEHQEWLDLQKEDANTVYTFIKDEDGKQKHISSPTPLHSTKTLESIFLPESIKVRITRPLDEFISDTSPTIYEQCGWPRKIGFLFHGPPGTGKTSLAYAICRYVRKPLLIVSASDVAEFIECGSKIKNRVVLLDDVDCFKKIEREHHYELKMDRKGEGAVEKRKYANAIFSDLLSLLDGNNTLHECVIIMTTNHPEQVDSTLMRPGRIDHHIEIAETTVYSIRKLFTAVFGAVLDDVPDDQIRTDLTMAAVTNCIVRANRLEPDTAVKMITKCA